jgi:hypothetical protein
VGHPVAAGCPKLFCRGLASIHHSPSQCPSASKNDLPKEIDGAKSSIDRVPSFADLVKSSVDLVKSFIDRVRKEIDRVLSFIDRVPNDARRVPNEARRAKSFVDLLPKDIDLLKSSVDRENNSDDLLPSFIDFVKSLVDRVPKEDFGRLGGGFGGWGIAPDAGEGGLDFFSHADDQFAVGRDQGLLGFDLGDDGFLC